MEELQKVIKEKDQKLQLFRQHLVLSQPLDSSSLQGLVIKQYQGISPLHCISKANIKHADKLKTASQPEVLDALKESEAERARHQAYLDQLLLLVIERCPELLNIMSAGLDNTRYSNIHYPATILYPLVKDITYVCYVKFVPI